MKCARPLILCSVFASLLLTVWSVPLATASTKGPASDSGPVEMQVRMDHRWDTQPRERNRLQHSLMLDTRVHVTDWLRVGAFASTGSKYATRWQTVCDWHKDTGCRWTSSFALRRLYVEFEAGPLRLQVGAITPFKDKISRITLAPFGWIDGGRLELRGEHATLELVMGKLGDFETPNLFGRSWDLDYVELELSQRLSPLFGVELGVEGMGDQRYVKAELSTHFEELLEGLPTTTLNALWHLNRDVAAVDLAMSGDLMKVPFAQLAGRLKARINVTYVPDNMGIRAKLCDDFSGTGWIFTMKLSGAILKEYGLGWYGRVHAWDEPTRWELGLTWKVKLG